MIGLNDIVVSFAVSYIAGSIPTLKDWLSNDKGFDSRLTECYNKALKKWTANEGIKDGLSNKMYTHLCDLKNYLLTKPAKNHNDINKLMAMWVDELHSDPICYNFIVEHKVDFINSKLDEFYLDLKKSIDGQLNIIQQGVESNSKKLDTIHQTLQQLVQSGNKTELVKLIDQILDTTIKNLIENLHTLTASRFLSELEDYASVVISNNPTIAEKINKLKQQAQDLTAGKLKLADKNHKKLDTGNISSLDILTNSNLNDWLYALSLHKNKTGKVVAMNREVVKQTPEYEEAFEAANKFYTLLNRTEIVNVFPIFRAMYCYWGFLVKGDNIWLTEYQSIDKSEFYDQKYYFQLIESAMLFMAGKPEEAFSLAVSIKDGIDASYINFLILLGFHTQKIDYTIWVLNCSIAKQIKIDVDGSKFLAFSVNKETATQLLAILPQLSFECEAEKNVIIQLCNNSLNRNLNTSDFKSKTDTLSDTILAYAAMLLAKNGDINLGFKLLNSKIEAGKMDLKQRLFIDILCMSTEHKPYLYQLLQQNRKRGRIDDIQLLSKEFELAMEVCDFENALSAMDILYDRMPDEEIIFVNYINALSRIHPERLPDFEKKSISFAFSHTEAVKFIYLAYAENGYLEFATEFLAKEQRSMNDDVLKHFFFTECIMGFIHPIVHREYEAANAGSSVLYSLKEDKYVEIVKSTTPLGKVLLNRKKGDVINFNGTELHIEKIYSKYYKERFDYMKEVLRHGGNEFMHMMNFNNAHPLQSMETLMKEVSSDSAIYGDRKLDALKKYENNEVGLTHLVDSNYILGSYYKLLFTSFKIHIRPIERYADRCLSIRTDSKFVLDLPACLILFEFSQKTGIQYKTRFQVSKYLYEFVKRTKKHIHKNMDFDFFEGIKNGNLKRFDEYADVDCEKRLQALVDWIDFNCDIEIATEALAISKPDDNLKKVLFSNTIVCLKKPHNYLVTDEEFFDHLLPGQLQIISTEALIHQLENEQIAKQYSEFLFECRFEGIHLEHDFIAAEYFKMEKGEPNRFNDIIQNGNKNPYIVINAINAALLIIQKTSNQSLANISLTDMFALILSNYSEKDFLSKEWLHIQKELNCPIFNFITVRECLKNALITRKSK